MKHSPRLPALQIHRLQLHRGHQFELNIHGLWLEKGKILAIAGANGSGKTTLIEAVAGLVSPQRGTIRILGHHQDARRPTTRSLYGFIPDDDAWIIPELTAQEYLELLMSIYERAGTSTRQFMTATASRLARQLMFAAFDQPLGSLSHGNRKKVQIIAALLHEPELLIVDELRNGLDPLAIKHAEDLMRELARHGTAILAATHDLWWAERIAHDVVMLDQGEIILDAPTARIVAQAGSVEAQYLALYEARR